MPRINPPIGQRITAHEHAIQSCEAAQATGMNRATILRAIKSGKISGLRDDNGVWAVEPVELHRVFPPASATPEPVRQDAHADALVAELRAQLADMRSQRDAWQGIAERLAGVGLALARWRERAVPRWPPARRRFGWAADHGRATGGSRVSFEEERR
jgi:hypothetical protein